MSKPVFADFLRRAGAFFDGAADVVVARVGAVVSVALGTRCGEKTVALAVMAQA